MLQAQCIGIQIFKCTSEPTCQDTDPLLFKYKFLFLLYLFMKYWEQNICFKLITWPLFWSQTIKCSFSLFFFPYSLNFFFDFITAVSSVSSKLMKSSFLWTAFYPMDTLLVKYSIWSNFYVVWLLANVYSLWPCNSGQMESILPVFPQWRQ